MTDPAKRHAPQTQDEYLAAALEMRTSGLYAADIAVCLGLSRNAVLQLLFFHDQAVRAAKE